MDFKRRLIVEIRGGDLQSDLVNLIALIPLLLWGRLLENKPLGKN